MTEKLVLRLHPAVITTSVVAGLICLAIGAIAMQRPAGGAGLVAAAGFVVGLLSIGLAVRSQLVLTPEGFRARHLWGGRLVLWSAVREFWPATGFLGAIWTPRERPPMPTGPWQWARAMWRSSRYEIALFGPSRRFLVDTLNTWRDRYSNA